jgi:ATP phosphoribosyltransferase
MERHSDIRLSLPSKGRLAEDAERLLAACGLSIYKPNPRQYAASIPALPGVTILFQRPGDIVVSVRDGSVDFGITGMDVVGEKRGDSNKILVLHDALGFGHCHLSIAVPEEWEAVQTVAALAAYAHDLDRPLRVATKYTNLTGGFMAQHDIPCILIEAEGTLEAAPAIGYADVICDLVSSGQTLRDNRLRPLEDGIIVRSQAALIANHAALQRRPEVLEVARKLLEAIEAHLRAEERLSIFANMRGKSPEAIAQALFAQEALGGLQGPTISRVVARDGDPNWYDVHIIVRRDRLLQAVSELRAIGGSGVVVAPVTYIFEEEPERIRAMMEAIEEAGSKTQENTGAEK